MIPNNGQTSTNAQPLPAGRGMPQVAPEMTADVDRLREDFRTFVSDCQTLLKNATNLSGEGAAIARAELSKRMSDAQVRLEDMRRTANDQAMRLRATTEDYVRREPFKAIGIAAGVGALVALLMSRR
jgi:ElaB/YqjD/DUF883 family membrane-anchored ribosome-binding protein